MNLSMSEVEVTQNYLSKLVYFTNWLTLSSVQSLSIVRLFETP